jgi:hypothetical protein
LTINGGAGCKINAATVYRGGNFFVRANDLSVSGMGSIRTESFGRISHFRVCPWHFQVFRIMDHVLAFKDGGSWFGIQG